MKAKNVLAIFVMMLLAAPVCTWAGALPDTGQDMCYDADGEALRSCPTICEDENGCLREFVDPDNDTKTISKYYYEEAADTYVEYAYYGFKDCYTENGIPETCAPIECRDRSGEKVDCPTGTTKCYRDNKGTVVTCPTGMGSGTTDLYGQDGNYVFDEPVYAKTDDKLDAVDADWTLVKEVKDAKENVILYWLVKEDFGPDHNDALANNASNAYAWESATTKFLKVLNSPDAPYKGYSDWRLPTIEELAAIVDNGLASPAIDISDRSGYFLNMKSDDVYWSSTSSPADATQAYAVNFDDGSIVLAAKTEAKYVIAVRGATSGKGEFVDNGDGTVTDTATGLMWLKNYTVTDDWEGAMLSCEALVSSEYDDWRLPSRNELNSIIDRTKNAPAADASFTIGSDTSYWTSTTYLKETEPAVLRAWAINFTDGTAEGKAKTEAHAIRPVRGGQNQADGVVISDPTQTSSWKLGRVMPIIWSNTGAIKGNVTISISGDAGKTFTPIVENLTNDGSYVWWSIGRDDKNANMGLAEADNYVLKIEQYVPEGEDPVTTGQNTQGFFSIEEDAGFGVQVDLTDIIKGLQYLSGQNP